MNQIIGIDEDRVRQIVAYLTDYQKDLIDEGVCWDTVDSIGEIIEGLEMILKA